MKIKSLLSAFVAAVILFTTSCNSDDPTPGTQIFLDIVTVASRTETGTVLTCRQGADTPLVTYTTTQAISGNFIKEGDRILISYTTELGRYVSGPISILAATTTAGAGAPVPEEDFLSIGDIKGTAVTMNTIWLTGNYLNAVFLAHSSTNYKTCRMVADTNTLDDEWPVIRIIFVPDSGTDESEYAFYMSYSVADIFARPNVKGVHVCFNDPSKKEQYVDIESTSQTIRPIE